MNINEQEVCIKLYPNSEEVIITLEQIKRRICLKEEILDVIDRIAYIRVLPIESEKYIKEIYQEAMDEYNEMKWVEIMKTEYLRRKRKKVHSFEKEYANRARLFLYSEISILLDIGLKSVENYIKETIKNEQW